MKQLFSLKDYGVRSLLLILLPFVLMLAFLSAPSTNAAEVSQNEALTKKAEINLKVALEQYSRGLYDQAEKTMDDLMANYYEYLGEDSQDQAVALAEDIAEVKQARIDISRALSRSDEYAAAGNMRMAISELEKISDSEYLTENERERINNAIAVLEEQAETQKPDGEIAITSEEFTAEQELLNAGEEKNSTDADSDYEMQMENEDRVEAVEETQENEQEATDRQAQPTPETAQQGNAQDQSGYIRVIEQKRSRQRSYTKAVVEDAKAKANQHLSENQFAQARQAVARAITLVNRNKLLLGDELYEQYRTELASLDDLITAREKEYVEQMEAQRREQTQQLRSEIRQTMEQQRKEAIQEYMARARAFQEQQRYKEALGQLEQLIALDPYNNDALILKRTLEDTVRYREQLEIQKKSNEEELKLLIEADRRSIPWAKEINFAKDWKEFTARREEEGLGKMSAEDQAINEMLDKTVDLSMLTEETTLEEAIEIIQNSVDPPLPIIVNWKDLSENAFIEKSEPIGISGQGLTNVKVRTGLSRLLDAVGGGFVEIGFVIEEGTITIATQDSLPSEYYSDSYDITELTSAPADFIGEDMETSSSGGRSGGSSRGGGSSGGRSGGSSRSSGSSRGGSSRGGSSGGRSGGSSRGGGGSGSDDLTGLADDRADDIRWVIQETIEPDTWYENGGEGRIEIFGYGGGSTKLVVWQTADVHRQIREFIKKEMESIGNQVAIETRFLLVDENYLEDIGIDMTIQRLHIGGKIGTIGTAGNPINFGSYEAVAPTASTVTSSLGGNTNPAMNLGFTYNDMDDLTVDFLVRATQMHANSKSLTAPKLMVLSGQRAGLMIMTERTYISDVTLVSDTVDITEDDAVTNFYFDPQQDVIQSHYILVDIQPTITSDKKYVDLTIQAELENELEGSTGTVQGTINGEVQSATYELPTYETTVVRTRVRVPDRGTVLLGGQTLTAEKEIEAGVPMLSKLPIVGRLFRNRSEVKDKQVLLILVKPTILLKEETEQDAIAAME